MHVISQKQGPEEATILATIKCSSARLKQTFILIKITGDDIRSIKPLHPDILPKRIVVAAYSSIYILTTKQKYIRWKRKCRDWIH